MINKSLKTSETKEQRTLMVKNLIRIKEQEHWSNKYIASKAGVSGTRINQMLNVTNPPRYKTLEKLSLCLDIPISEILRSDIEEYYIGALQNNNKHYRLKDAPVIIKQKPKSSWYHRTTIKVIEAKHKVVQYMINEGNDEEKAVKVAEDIFGK